MRKLSAILWVPVLVMLCIFLTPMKAMAAEVDSGTCGDNLTWSLDSNGTLTISGSGAMADYEYNYGSCTYPWANFALSVKKVVINYSVTSIGDYAFAYCKNLTSVSFGSRVTRIGASAFRGCTGLTSISIGSRVTSIEDSAFRDCTGLTSITIPASVTTLEDNVFLNCSGMTKAVIGNGVKAIGNSAFRNCYKLTNVTIGSKVASIGKRAFYNCDGLISITIPSGVTYIGERAFYSCDQLRSITFPASVTDIDAYAFGDCLNLTSVTINCNVEYIRNAVFAGCVSLTNINIPTSVTNIGSSAFFDCTSLNGANIPESVIDIGNYAFYNCTGLMDVKIPTCVTRIGASAFRECTGLEAVHIADLAAWCGMDFESPASNPLLYAKKLYLNENMITKLEIPAGVTEIDNYAFCNCDSLTSITIPGSVTRIGGATFADCTGLTEVVIPDGVTSVGNLAFYNCTNLKSITLPNSVARIGSAAFANCSNLTGVTIPTGVTHISSYLFYNCDSMTDFVVPTNVTSIGKKAFEGCDAFANVYYCDSEEQWQNINVAEDNVYLTDATLNYHSYVDGICTICGAEAPHEHKYTSTVISAPSCTGVGMRLLTCNCGDRYAEIIPALGHSYVAVVTEPTCVAGGYTTYICSVCGHSYKANETAATGIHTYDNDSDADCNVCGETREVGPEKADDLIFTGTPSLSFQDYIGMQVSIYSSLLNNYDEIYVEAIQIDPVNGAITTKLNGFLYYYDILYVFDQQILSWSMAEEVTLTLYGVKDGVTYVGQTYTASVESLALGMLEHNAVEGGNAKLCTVLVDMLNYGAAVQTVFKHNETLLPNTQVSAYASFGTEGTPAMGASVVKEGTGSIVVYQDSISMQSKVELQLLFLQDVSAYTAKAVVNGVAKDVYMDTETMGAYGWTVLRVAVGAAEMRETFTIALYDANGNPVTAVYEASAEAYAKGLLGGSQNDVAVTMMRYGDAVAAYAKG